MTATKMDDPRFAGIHGLIVDVAEKVIACNRSRVNLITIEDLINHAYTVINPEKMISYNVLYKQMRNYILRTRYGCSTFHVVKHVLDKDGADKFVFWPQEWWESELADESDTVLRVEERELHSAVCRALGRLSKMERDIVVMRIWGEKEWSEIGSHIGKCGERARQIFLRAGEKLCKRLQSFIN